MRESSVSDTMGKYAMTISTSTPPRTF